MKNQHAPVLHMKNQHAPVLRAKENQHALVLRAKKGPPGMSRGSRQRGPLVLQVIPRLGIGGAERAVVDIARAVVAAGGRALVVSEGGALEAQLPPGGARHVALPVAAKSPLAVWRNGARLARLIRSEGVDLVHARSRAPAWSALLAARRTGKPFVTTFHAAYNAGSALKRRYNAVMAKGERVIAISDFVAAHVRCRYGVGDDRLRRIPRGIDVAGFDPAAVAPERVAALAARWKLPAGLPVVMLPGRLTRWKGQDVLVHAMRLLDRDAVCLLVGAGRGGHRGFARALAGHIAAAGLEERVLALEDCHDMPAAYRLADVVVSASIEPEGFGRAVVEAQAMGVPVIATDHGGARETVEEGVTGWLVPPGDAAALARAIAAALSLDGQARARLAATARERACRRFTRQAMCAATLEVYRELIDWP